MSIESGWAFCRIERGDTAAGAGAYVNKPSAVTQCIRGPINSCGDFWKHSFYGDCHFLIFGIDDSGDLECRLRVELARRSIRLLSVEPAQVELRCFLAGHRYGAFSKASATAS